MPSDNAMKSALILQVNGEIARGIENWADVDTTPEALLSAAVEELGQAAHAINHNEGIERARQEVAEAIGVLSWLWDIVEIYQRPAPVVVSLDQIVKEVVEECQIRHIDLKGRSKKQHLVEARQVAMYLMRQETDRPLREISEVIGRSPSTVSYAYSQVAAAMKSDPELRRTVVRIQHRLRA